MAVRIGEQLTELKRYGTSSEMLRAAEADEPTWPEVATATADRLLAVKCTI